MSWLAMRWLRATDHRTIGRVYGVASAGFLLVGLALVAVLRWQLAYPGTMVPAGELLASWFGERLPGGRVGPELYLQLGAMHGTIMIFLGVVPMLVGGFGSFFVPSWIGASTTAFPRLHRLSLHVYLASGVVMLGSFFVPGGAARSGWTSYPPLADLEPMGQSWWLVGMGGLGLSSIFTAIVLITTIVQLRAESIGWHDLSFVVWSQGVSAVLLLLAFPPLLAASLLQWMDRVVGTSFFLPSGLVHGGQVVDVAGGGSPVLWQHLFWFLAHPEVYVLLLPGLGLVAWILPAYSGRPLWGERAMSGSAMALGVLSFLVWAHHMFLTGMGSTLSAFFQTTTMLVSIPTVVMLTALVLSLWGGRIRLPTAMCFAVASLPMFGLGGLTGLPLGLAASDVHLHDTNYVVGHFHFLVGPGTLFTIFAGIYHAWPRIAGRRLDERWGKLHFWGSLVTMPMVFAPMMIQGLQGLHRRLWDGGATYEHLADAVALHVPISWAVWALAVAQLPFLWNLAASLRRPATDDLAAAEPARSIPWAATTRPDTGLSNVVLGTGLALASATMFFGGLVAALIFLRTAFTTEPAIAWRSGEPWPAAASGNAVAWLDAFAGCWLIACVVLVVLSIRHRIVRDPDASEHRARGLCLQVGWLFVGGLLIVLMLSFGVLVGGFS